jgi:hypothetical protein
MKDHDQIILEQAYTNKIVKPRKILLEDLADNEYEAEVELDLFHSREPNGYSLDDYGIKVRVRYTLELDIRSYGIKDVSVYGLKIDPFTVDWYEGEEGEKPAPIEVNVEDASGIKIDTGSDRSITLPFYPVTLELHLDDNFKVIPEQSSLIFNQSNGL